MLSSLRGRKKYIILAVVLAYTYIASGHLIGHMLHKNWSFRSKVFRATHSRDVEYLRIEGFIMAHDSASSKNRSVITWMEKSSLRL